MTDAEQPSGGVCACVGWFEECPTCLAEVARERAALDEAEYRVVEQHQASLRERWQMAWQITRLIGWGRWRLHKVTLLMVLRPKCQAAYYERKQPPQSGPSGDVAERDG